VAIDFQTEQDVDYLRRVGAIQQRDLGHALKLLARQSNEVDLLRNLAGGTTLQRSLELLNDDSADTSNSGADSSSASKQTELHENKGALRPRRGHGPTPQPELAQVTETYEADEADEICPSCGDLLKPLDGQSESSEMIDVVEVEYRRVTVQRQKYVCPCGCIETAPGPERATVGGRYSLEFGAKVLVDKYADHMPLDRQARAMKRHGLEVHRQTLWDQVWALCCELEPVHEALIAHILAQPVIGLDQTGWPDLSKRKQPKTERAKNRPYQLWALTSLDAVAHEIRSDKSAATMRDIIGAFDGIIVADMLGTHEAARREAARDGPTFTLAGCWAHVRRRFADAEKDFPAAREMLDMIRQLYDIELGVTDDQRGEARKTRSAAVCAQIKAWLGRRTEISSTSLGSAAKFTMKYWGRLTRFLDDPAVWLDNNRTERSIRGPAVGRRNHFGSKSRRGTLAAAIAYSVIETAKLHDIDVRKYVVAAIKRLRLTDGREVLMPWDFQV
jgi:transposase